MSLVQPTVAERRNNSIASANLGLSSNNPFRNRAGSPAMPSPSSGTSTTNPRPVSRNPFLSAVEVENNSVGQTTQGGLVESANAVNGSHAEKPTYVGATEELFKNLTFDDNHSSSNNGLLPPFRRTETLPHIFGEEKPSSRNGPNRVSKPNGLMPPSDAAKKSENRRPRRNSESSIASRKGLSEEDRKRRERRQRDRDDRQADGKPRPSRSRRPHGLDLIDKLDVTGIYGPGLFHHDGPFDACNPHRNRKKDHRAPMQAFPANSANNAIGGSGPVNKSMDYNQFHGRGAEGFTDYGSGYDGRDPYAKLRPAFDRTVSFDPKDRVEVHGEESVGLGTSTFLEGAPASRNAIQRRESESDTTGTQGGLSRKKSLAQRIKGISGQRRPGGFEGGRITSPEARYDMRSPTSPERAPLAAQGPHSAGGRLRSYEKNPFFSGDEDAGDKEGAGVKLAESEKADDLITRERALSSPKKVLERQRTSESVEPGPKPVSGFLNRVRSLKGGRRARPERTSG